MKAMSSTTPPVVKADDFGYRKEIKSGEFGKVFMCNYTGEDPRIKNLATPYRNEHGDIEFLVIIKEAKTASDIKPTKRFSSDQLAQQARSSLQDEIRVTDDLTEQEARRSPHKPRVNLGVGAQYSDGTPILISRYETLLGNDPTKSASLGADDAVKAINQNPTTIKDSTALIAQLGNGMYESLKDMGDFVHGDAARRNFMVKGTFDGKESSKPIISMKTMAIDYGYTRKVDSQTGRATYNDERMPYKQVSRSVLKQREITKYDDVYNNKLNMIEMLAENVGCPNPVGFDDARGAYAFYYKRIGMSDSEALSHFLEKVERVNEAKLKQNPDDYLAQNNQIFIEAYRGYLTSHTDLLEHSARSSQGIETLCDRDAAKLQQANGRFVQGSMNKLQQEYHQAKDQLSSQDKKQAFLSLQRVLYVENIPLEMKKSPGYQGMVRKLIEYNQLDETQRLDFDFDGAFDAAKMFVVDQTLVDVEQFREVLEDHKQSELSVSDKKTWIRGMERCIQILEDLDGGATPEQQEKISQLSEQLNVDIKSLTPEIPLRSDIAPPIPRRADLDDGEQPTTTSEESEDDIDRIFSDLQVLSHAMGNLKDSGTSQTIDAEEEETEEAKEDTSPRHG